MTSPSWLSVHLYYHQDRSRLLAEWLEPSLEAWQEEKKVGRFFFVRYELGGPHLRLRLEPLPRPEHESFALELEESFRHFVRAAPSERQLAESAIFRQAQLLGENLGTIPDDNTLALVPFEPEVERYGGPKHLGAAFDFFTISSREALIHSRQCSGLPLSQRLPRLLTPLLHQALGASRDPVELKGLLTHAYHAFPASIREPAGTLASKAYGANASFFERLLRQNLDAATRGELSTSNLFAGAQRLRLDLDVLPAQRRQRALQSHQHMSANRLGLTNAEEALAARLCELAAGSLEDSAPD